MGFNHDVPDEGVLPPEMEAVKTVWKVVQEGGAGGRGAAPQRASVMPPGPTTEPEPVQAPDDWAVVLAVGPGWGVGRRGVMVTHMAPAGAMQVMFLPLVAARGLVRRLEASIETVEAMDAEDAAIRAKKGAE